MLTDEDLLARIRTDLHHPTTVRELMRHLRLPRGQRALVRRRLAALVDRGALVRTDGDRYAPPDGVRALRLGQRQEDGGLVAGRLQVNPRGFGFVTPDRPVEGLAGDLYVAASRLNHALHGDRVIARVERRREAGRAMGSIVRVVERAATRLVGRFEDDVRGAARVVPFDRRVVTDVRVPAGAGGGAAPGDMVEVELTAWPSPERDPAGRVTEVLGDAEAPGVDTRVVIHRHGLPDAHDDDAIAEARRLGTEVRARDTEGRTDFRGLPTVTIDGESARDFDDAVTLDELPGGRYRLGVHIADVAHYVQEDGALDRAAGERGTSVYFPDRAVHMFPPELATGLCSLQPGVDRLVQSCVMEIGPDGEVVRYELHDGVIHSDARMTYTDVNALLTGRQDGAGTAVAHLGPLLERMAVLFERLHGRRRRRGSIDFDLPEARFLLDDAGRVEAIVAAERNLAHRIVEEFMLVANETVARHLATRGVPGLFRVHEAPDPARVEDFEAFAATLGHGLAAPPGVVEPLHFQRLIDRLADSPEARPVALLMLRTMQQARYDPADLGHFGLAAASYTHFTSPIRRYPDLVVHRVLRAARRGGLDADRRRTLEEDLPGIARRSSERERRAEEAERELVHWKKVRFMADRVGDEFTGYVTGAASFGLFVEIVDPFVEGLVHVSSMADDYYRFVAEQHLLHGERSGRTYRLGDRVRVRLVRVDRERRQLDLALVDVLDAVRRGGEGRAPRPRSRARADGSRGSGRGRRGAR